MCLIHKFGLIRLFFIYLLSELFMHQSGRSGNMMKFDHMVTKDAVMTRGKLGCGCLSCLACDLIA